MQNSSDVSGNNINQKINPEYVAKEFLGWFYNNINKNVDNLFPKLWKEYSEIDINGEKIKGLEQIYINMKKIFNETHSQPESFQYILNGSRCIILLTTGKITKNNITKNFSKVFQLTHNKNVGWFVKNLMIKI